MTDDKKIQEKISFSAIRKNVDCQNCGRSPLVALPPNYPTVDIVCQFCSQTAQVKSLRLRRIDSGLPNIITAAAWGPQKKRMNAGIFQPLYIVTFYGGKAISILYISPGVQKKYQKILFKKRKPLPDYNKRAGWQGFNYMIGNLPKKSLKLLWRRKH